MWDKKTGYRIKLGLLIAVLLVFCLYLLNKWMLNGKNDTSYPVITFDQELLEVSVKATQEDLLQGVQASDQKDGDVTDSIIIESVSNLLEGNERIVTYVAFDKDNHVGKAERRIRYTDYTSPHFELSEPVKITSTSTELSAVLAPLHAVDCIDGDISDSILLINSTRSAVTDDSVLRIYDLQVTNSCGEMASIEFPIRTNEDGLSTVNRNAQIVLSDYLIYLKKGERVDLDALIEEVLVHEEEVEHDLVSISTDLDRSQPGVYLATYSLETENAGASCDLVIVVEE